MFSRRTTSPSFIASTAAFAFSPTTVGSAANFTSCPNNSDNLAATGANDNSGFGSPFGLPMCEQRITFPPSAINFLIVGRAATRRFSSVIFPSTIGTLKSHLTKTLRPFTLISSTDFLLSIMLPPYILFYLFDISAMVNQLCLSIITFLIGYMYK